jgi:hypothetical protein
MPVKKKEFELDDGTKIWVRQASGLERLKISNAQAKVFREFESFGEPVDWTNEQQLSFAEALDEAGCGIEDQLQNWLPNCVMDSDFDHNIFTLEELMPILAFIRGDEDEGSVSFL